MKILFIASEAAPLAKTGGLADVVGSLPKELKRQGHEVRLIIPFYRTVTPVAPVTVTGISAEITCGSLRHRAGLSETAVDGITVYLLDNAAYFDREYLYGTPAGDYPDNHRRFAFFCRGALALMELAGFCPDILHCHDWHTALVPLLLTQERNSYPFFSHSAVVHTIHNLAYQGLFPKESLPEMGLDPALFRTGLLEYYGRANLMKGGILTADSISTVSQTYREEIVTAAQGCGLEGVLQQRGNDLYGILNGLDYEEWNPGSDPELYQNFTAAMPQGKAVNKGELQKALGLEVNPALPLVGLVSRLVEQKGIALIAELLPRLVGMPLQLVILGTGDDKYTSILEEVKSHEPANISINLDFSPQLAPKIYAACDLFLMPSRFEPCGLGQLIALRYGAVPVVRKTGGLADTVIDPGTDPTRATGFTFDDYTPEALWQAISRALRAYWDRPRWAEMVRRGMTSDFSWETSARRYEALYLRTLAAKRRPEP